MSGKSVELHRRLIHGGRDWPTCGKGRHRLSPRRVQEGQEVDPGRPPVPQRGMKVNSVRIRRGSRRDVGSQGQCIPWPRAAGTGGG